MNTALEKHFKMTVAALHFALALDIPAWGLTDGLSPAGGEQRTS